MLGSLRFPRFCLNHLPGQALPPCNRTKRSHEGCGEEWDAGDVVGLRLCLDYQLDAGSLLEGLGEVAIFAPGYDVVAECLEVAVGDDGDSEGGVLAAVFGDAAAG
jgi:hypothetical protein